MYQVVDGFRDYSAPLKIEGWACSLRNTNVFRLCLCAAGMTLEKRQSRRGILMHTIISPMTLRCPLFAENCDVCFAIRMTFE